MTLKKNMEMNKESKDWCLSYNTHQEMGVYICYNGHIYDNIMTLWESSLHIIFESLVKMIHLFSDTPAFAQ